MNKYTEELVKRLVQIIKLSVTSEQAKAAEDLFSRYTAELEEKLPKNGDPETIKGVFKPYINNILSVVETMINKETNEKTFRGCRRLMLNEIYGYQNVLLTKGGVVCGEKS